MILSRKRQAVLLTASLLALSIAPAISPAAAKGVCWATFKKGKASHPVRILASKGAIKSWKAVVASTVGVEWSKWKYATAKSLPCKKSAMTGRWNCQAIAKPCKPPTLQGLGGFQAN